MASAADSLLRTCSIPIRRSVPFVKLHHSRSLRQRPQLKAYARMSAEDNHEHETEPLLHDSHGDQNENALQPTVTSDTTRLGKAGYCLMGSYALAAWAWRSWEFAVALLLIDLYPDSLRLVSLYGLVDNGVRIVFGSRVGAFISRHDLVPGATAMYLSQNACIGLSAASAMALLLLGGPDAAATYGNQVYGGLLTVMVLLGALSSVGSSGVRIAVEAQAVAALAGGNSTKLSRLNAGFRAIDLSALLAAPMLVGAVMTWLGPTAATLLLGAYTLLAWIPELVLLRAAVKANPSIAVTRPRHAETSPNSETQPAEPAKPGFWSDLKEYCSQTVLLPQLAIACLYCTVLSLGFLMTSYLQWSGLTSAEVSVYRGGGALAGLAATALFPMMVKRLGVLASGWIGGFYQLACLSVGVLPIILAAVMHPGGILEPFKPTAAMVRALVTGVALSRTGLWTFDLAVTQLVQERVPKHQLGVVAGFQSSLQACFETLSFLAGLYFHDPEQFHWLMIGSLGLVTLAFTLYSSFSLKQSCSNRSQGSMAVNGIV